MHDEGGSGFALVTLSVIALLCFFSPTAAQVVFGLVPAVATAATNAITGESEAITKDGIVIEPMAIVDTVAPLAESAAHLVQDNSSAVLRATGSALAAPPKAIASAVIEPFAQSDVAEASSVDEYSVPVTSELASVAVAVESVSEPIILAQASDYHVPTDGFTVPSDASVPDVSYSSDSETSNSLLDYLNSLWSAYVPIGIFFSILFFAGIIYVYMRTAQVKHAEHEAMHGAHHGHGHHDAHDEGPSQNALRFKQVVDLSNTNNPNDWRVAILEADIMLDELLTSQGYIGQTLSDKLKQVSKGEFQTIDLAWEAHKLRNKVAHDGAGLSLNEREVRRVIGMFGQVFKEFKFI